MAIFKPLQLYEKWSQVKYLFNFRSQAKLSHVKYLFKLKITISFEWYLEIPLKGWKLSEEKITPDHKYTVFFLLLKLEQDSSYQGETLKVPTAF